MEKWWRSNFNCRTRGKLYKLISYIILYARAFIDESSRRKENSRDKRASASTRFPVQTCPLSKIVKNAICVSILVHVRDVLCTRRTLEWTSARNPRGAWDRYQCKLSYRLEARSWKKRGGAGSPEGWVFFTGSGVTVAPTGIHSVRRCSTEAIGELYFR